MSSSCLAASAYADNTRGFAALADEIYLEIVSYIPSVPIPTSIRSELYDSYREIRRSRHETLLSLSQTSRSLRRVFWRYLWQRIEVREGMKIGNTDDTLKSRPFRNVLEDPTRHKTYATELVRQLEIVTIRNPQLAQYVNYLDIFIGEYSFRTVLPELARCLSLFSNLHTVQIDLFSRDSGRSLDRLGKFFERTFKKYSYPQIRNVFIMSPSKSFIASCPQTRHIGYPQGTMPESCLKTIKDNCPHLEVLEDFSERLWNPVTCKLVVDSCPNLRMIAIIITPALWDDYSYINIFKELKQLQSIIINWIEPAPMMVDYPSPENRERAKTAWIESAKRTLIEIQLHDNLRKTVVLRPNLEFERRILIKPASIGFEEEGT